MNVFRSSCCFTIRKMFWLSQNVLAFILVFQVVPRIVLEALPAVLLFEKKQKAKAIDIIVSECR
jgi:hypothetical protein